MGYAIVAFVSLLAGGFGGYMWGRSVEAKAGKLINVLSADAKNIPADLRKS